MEDRMGRGWISYFAINNMYCHENKTSKISDPVLASFSKTGFQA